MKKLSVIIPYRDRLQDLKILLPCLKQTLKEENISNNIVVVEQDSGEIFNRGCLKNIGSIISEKDSDYFCFHDVDMFPDSVLHNYSYEKGGILLATSVEQFNYKKPYSFFFGGVVLLDKDDFKKINGYSTVYWGWGSEDDDLLLRCLLGGVKVKDRDHCKFNSNDHQRDKSTQKRNQEIREYFYNNRDMYNKFGLNSIRYSIISDTPQNIANTEFRLIKTHLYRNEYHPCHQNFFS